jgi:cell division septation protein DedD
MPDPNSNAVYRVQVGSFENRNLARAVFDRLKNAGFNPSYQPYNNMFRVVIPGIRAADMPQVARRLWAAGFTSAWIRREN